MARKILSSSRSRQAFTLIELLVVIAIIGVLIGLLLPAVQKVREAANKIKCANNLKQLTLALHNYHNTNDSFPAGWFWIEDCTGTSVPCRWTWIVKILPYMEQDPLAQAYDYKNYLKNEISGPQSTDGYKQSITATVLTNIVCPADTLPGPPITDHPEGVGGGNKTQWYALTSYVGNAGTDDLKSPAGAAPLDGVLYVGAEPLDFDFTQMRYPPAKEYPQVSIPAITDGTSNTILIGERSHYDPNFLRVTGDDLWRYGHWTFPKDRYVLASTRVKINFQIDPSTPSHPQRTNTTGVGPGLSPPSTQQDAAKSDRLSCFGSQHPGGANMAFGDGAVHFIRDDISHATLMDLSTRGKGEVISEDY